MVSKPAVVGVLGGVAILAALGLNFWLVPGDEDEAPERAATVAVPTKPAAPKSDGQSVSRNATSQGSGAQGTASPSTTSQGTASSAGAPDAASAETAPPTDERRPSFDIVRVDPDGNAVIAGRARPNAEVTILDGEREIGSVTSDERGEWVFLPDQQLGPGQFALTLRQDGDGATAESEEAVVLVVPEPGKDIAGRATTEPSQPLAMVLPRDEAAPGTARVLQAPAAGPAPAGPASADASASDPAGAAGTAPPPMTDSATDGTVTAAAKEAEAPQAVAAGAPAAGGDASSAPSLPLTAAEVDRAPASGSGDAPAAAGTPVAALPDQAAPDAAPAAAATDAMPPPAAGGDPATSAPVIQAFPQPSSAPSAADQSPVGQTAESGDVSVDVIEYDDKGEVVFGGRTEPNAEVEVFIDDKPAGTATADSEGRWQVTPDDPVAPGNYNLRVEKVAPGGTVKARVAFPFVRAAPLTGLPNDRLVVIQPGNNLWLIATRVYGQGLRYVEIHDANRDQIQNPDLIFPGQVFGLPTVN